MSKITSRGIDFDDDDAKSRRFFMSETPYLKLKTLILILKKIQVGADLKLCCVALHWVKLSSYLDWTADFVTTSINDEWRRGFGPLRVWNKLLGEAIYQRLAR